MPNAKGLGKAVASKPNDEKPWLFKSGNPGGGRPLGSRNKLSEAFTEALYADFQKEGTSAIEKMRAEDASGYVRVIAGLLPKEMKIESAPLSDMSDDELSRLIDIIRAATSAPGEARVGTKETPRPPVTH